MKNWIEEIKKDNSKLIGEIIASSSSDFTIRAYELEKAPEYATILCSNSGETIIFGLVSYVSMEPESSLAGSMPKPLKRSREELNLHYKELKDKLVILAKLITIGYYYKGKFYQERPRRIPWIHDLVYLPDNELIREFHFIENKISLEYIPLIYTYFPENEKNIFNLYLKAYLQYLSNFFKEDEIYELFGSIHESLTATKLEKLIDVDMINSIFEEILTKKTIS
jgi:hypothetical protein